MFDSDFKKIMEALPAAMNIANESLVLTPEIKAQMTEADLAKVQEANDTVGSKKLKDLSKQFEQMAHRMATGPKKK